MVQLTIAPAPDKPTVRQRALIRIETAGTTHHIGVRVNIHMTKRQNAWTHQDIEGIADRKAIFQLKQATPLGDRGFTGLESA